MTVRRYPTVSPAPAPSSTRSHWAGRKPPSSGLLEVPGRTQPPAPPAAAQLSREEEKGLEKSPASCLSYSHSSNVKLFQEHVYKCQGKVKAVSFLLPTDMSSFAEKQGSLKSPQNQSTKHLMTITEKDM
uniref:putative coiled-coil domain-containing protein 195 n=1 Tax=Lonchura striata TaxID=40157 RepID=UPI00129392D4|nr:putative coiled-coil domain-containing protein 195 [Lonchura striata domestica]